MRIPTHHTRDRQHDTAMTPMIDVVFNLLVFFVCTVSFQAAEYSLRTSISVPPTAATQQVVEREQDDLPKLVVKVLRAANTTTWSLNNGQPLTLPQLKSQLQLLARTSSELKLILDVDGAIPLGDVVTTYDACLLAGFQKIQFAASRKA